MLLALLGLLSLNIEAKGDMPLVISEIQKSIEKSYKVAFPNQNPMPRPVQNLVEEDELVPSPAPVVSKKEIEKAPEKKSPGQIKIEEQLAKNRAILKKRQQDYFDSVKGLKKGKTQDEGAKRNDNGDWLKEKQKAQDNWVKEKKAAVSRWQENRLATLKQWQEARNQFKKDLPKFKRDLTEIPFGSKEIKISTKKPKNMTPIKVSTPVAVATTPETSGLELAFIEDAFRIPVRSQGTRPTCAAFAAVRAMEILAKAQGKERDLSEQYFYFASKPDCQQSPCQRPGSWPRLAYENSQNADTYDIPLEKDCPYEEEKRPGNETQIPLNSRCRTGVAKVSQYSMVENRHEIQERLRKGQPVIGGFKLSDDFFLNTGFVFKEKGQKVGKDLHAQGHAILLVGVMELPQSLHATQGRYCTLIANSWGEGWGRGGHACISDKWFDEFRYQIPFIALEKVAVR